MNKTLSFYVHIPYCVKRCGYCDFNTYTPSELRIGGDFAAVSHSYIDLLLKESDLVPDSGPIPTIFFGGGTPTLMEPSDLSKVLHRLRDRFGFTDDCEITIEANPDTVSLQKLEELRTIGINRISFGMQSAIPHVLATLDRTHNPENVVKATNWARTAGFDEVSVDLIYGAPGETIAEWEETINQALSLPISHVSAYALIVEEGTKFAAQVRRGDVVMPDEDETADKYLLADQKFSAAGLHWYEVSNWAKPGSHCRHNVAYWEGKNWWGLGPGAHSHINGKRWWNVKHPSAYADRLSQGIDPAQSSEILTSQERESERVMLAIRLPAGIAQASLTEEQVQRIRTFMEQGHLDEQGWSQGFIRLTLSGRLLADRIVREILA
ncbi:MAG: radical SAM family heme chaperone HemW [Actinomycetes bacterium]